jgi:hypothetical protein
MWSSHIRRWGCPVPGRRHLWLCCSRPLPAVGLAARLPSASGDLHTDKTRAAVAVSRGRSNGDESRGAALRAPLSGRGSAPQISPARRQRSEMLVLVLVLLMPSSEFPCWRADKSAMQKGLGRISARDFGQGWAR